MELAEAYVLYKNKIQENSMVYATITNSDDSMVLSSFLLLKTYRKYILFLTDRNKSPRISNIKDITLIESKVLAELIEACVVFMDTFLLNHNNVLVEDDEIVDPYDLITIMLEDCLLASLSEDKQYENIIKSIFNIIAETTFEKLLKNIFLKLTHMKIKE